jgi:hypothetical protein
MAKKTDEELAAEQAALDAENMGTGGKARDGEPNGDGVASLEDRRRGKTAAQLDTEGNEKPVGQDEEHDGQQAWDVDPAGKKMSLGSLIPRGKPVEYKTQVDGTSTKLKGGINDPSIEQVAVSALYTSKFTISYTRDDRGEIVKTIVTEHKTPRAINPAKSEAAQLMLAEQPDAATG